MQIWYYILICLPATVCLGWTLWFLLFNQNKTEAKRFLGWMMFVGWILYLIYIPYFLHKFSTFILLLPVYTMVSLLVYPMYHHYVKLLVEEKEHGLWQNIYWPAPVFGLLIYFNLLTLNNAGRMRLEDFFQGSTTAWSQINDFPVFMLILLYVLSRIVFSLLVIYTVYINFRLIQRYQKQLTSYYSDPENHSIHALNYILAGMILTSIYSVVANSIGIPFFLDKPFLLIIPALSISLLIFFLGYLGNKFNVVKLLDGNDESNNHATENELIFGDQFLANFQRVVLDEKAFLIPGIKITSLCEKLETNRTYLSIYINRTYQCNFCVLINKLRIAHSVEMLNQEAIEKYSMNYLSERCGFSSINTFYRTFQKEYGMTPGQYLKHRESKTEPQ